MSKKPNLLYQYNPLNELNLEDDVYQLSITEIK